MTNRTTVVIGCSTGGLQALHAILSPLPKNFAWPIAVVQHLSPDSHGALVNLLAERTSLAVKEAEDKEPLLPGIVYIAPANYHLLVEKDGTLSLSVDERENHSRPSIDVLFESAAEALGSALVGVLLTGANADGAVGLQKIKREGGFAIVQDPSTAIAPEMPRAAIRSCQPDQVLPLAEIGTYLSEIANRGGGS